MKVFFALVALLVTACLPPQASAQTIQTYNVSRGALSGTFQQIGFYYSVNADCSPQPRATVRIATPPAHGWFYIEPVAGYPNFPANNQRYQCNTRQVPGTGVVYRSQDGYLGADTGTVEVLFASGLLQQVRFDILVR